MNFEEKIRPHLHKEAFKSRRRFANGKGRTSAFDGNGNAPRERKGKQEKRFKGEKNEEDISLRKLDKEKKAQIIFEKKQDRDSIQKKREFIDDSYRAKKESTIESLALIEKYITKSGKLRKRILSSENSFAGVEGELSDLREERKKEDRKNLNRYLRKRDNKVDMEEIKKRESNKESFIKILKKEIGWLKADIESTKIKGGNPAGLINNLTQKQEKLNRLLGIENKTVEKNNLEGAVFENTDLSQNTNTKIRHWPPEGFTQKTGVIRRWPSVIDLPANNSRNGAVGEKENEKDVNIRNKNENIELEHFLKDKEELEKHLAWARDKGANESIRVTEMLLSELNEKISNLEKFDQSTEGGANQEKQRTVDALAGKIIAGATWRDDGDTSTLSKEESDFYDNNKNLVNKRASEIQKQNIENQENRTSSEKREAFKELGFSDNQIDWVLSDKDKKFILKNNLSAENWLTKKRELNSRNFKTENAGEVPANEKGSEHGNGKGAQKANLSESDTGRNSVDIFAPPGTDVETIVNESGSTVTVRTSSEGGVQSAGREPGAPTPAVAPTPEKITESSSAGVENVGSGLDESSPDDSPSDTEKTPQINDLSYEEVANRKFDSLWESREDKLVALGWEKEEYKILTDDEREAVYWRGITKEDYFKNESESSRVKKETQEESQENPEENIGDMENNVVSEETLENIASVLVARERELTPREQAIHAGKGNEIGQEIQKIQERINKILDEVWDTIEPNEKGEFLINIENDEDREFANKYGKLVVAEIQRRKKEIELTAKGVSLGAKKFLKNEVELSKSEKERQKLFEGLESAYENFDKPKLQEIASLKELATGGNKQKLIERIIEHDITNGLESLDLIQDQSIKDKLDNLNISQKEMINISPEFFSLTPEKQQYLISKLEQKIYLDADLSSKDQNEEEIKKMGWFKKIGASFRKDGRQAGLRDEAIEKIKNEGLQNYKDDISVLGKYLTDAPNLTYKQNEKGKLVPHFEYLETGNSENKNLETVKSFFNTAASRFGEIPYEWSLKTATSSQQEAYRKAHESYVSAKNALSKTILNDVEKQYPGASKKGAEEEIAGKYRDAQMEAMLMIRKADAGVNFGRYITQNPEMERMTSTWLQKTLGTDLGNWGRGAGYAAVGFATKWLGRTFAATGVGLAVAGAAGGFLADRKKRLEFDAKELRKRYGKDVEELGIKKSVNSENVHERLEKLVNQFEKTTDEKSKARILETIKTRLFVTDEMMRDGRINFGKSKDQVMNQFKLSDLMSKASILVEMNGGFGENSNKEVVFDKFDNSPQKEEQVLQRFKQFIEDDKAQSEKDKARAMAALKGAGVAMLGFGIGAGARYAHELGFFESALEKLKDAKDTVGGITWDWLKGEGGVPEEIPGKVRTGGFGPTPEMIKPEYEAFESMDVGSRGMIGGIQDLQKSLLAKFEGGEIPAQYQEFLEKDAHDIAREWGAYRPGEENESAKVFKGAKFEIGKNGEVVFVDHKGAMQKVFAPEVGANKNFEGDFFNSSKDRVPVSPFEANAGQQSVDIEKIIAEKEAQGFERSKSGFGEVLSKTEPTPSRGEPSIWDKPPATEYGEPVPVGEYGDIRGSYKFIEGPNGEITGIDTRKLISDKVIEFRKNPRSFITDDLTQTDLLAKTDSFAIKTVTENRKLIETLLELISIQNSPSEDFTPDKMAWLNQEITRLDSEVSKATGGAFDSKAPASRSSVFEAIEKPARVPERTISFDTDEIATESSTPENVSEVAPSSPSRLPRIDFIQSADGKMVIPVSVESFWNYDDNPVARKMAMEKLVNPKYHEVLTISSDFDRLARAQEYLDSGLYQKGSGEYQGIEDYIARQKEAISTKRLSGAKDVFDVSAESLPTGRVSLGGAEYVSSRTKINLESNILADIARRYVTGENFEFSGNIMKLGENHVGIYEESSSERVLSGMLNSQYRLNADKLGVLIEEKIEPTPDGRYRMIRVYKLKK